MILLLRKALKGLVRARARGLRRSVVSMRVPPSSMAYFASGGIGDILMAYPAVSLLRSRFPSARIDLYVASAKAGLARAVLSGCAVRPMPEGAGVLVFLVRRYDCAFANTISAFKVGIEIAALLAAPRGFGFRYPDEEERDRLYSLSHAIADRVHDSEQNVNLVCAVLDTPPPSVADLLPRVVHRPDPSSILLHPGAEEGYDYKRWPVTRFRELAMRFVDTGAQVAVLLGPSEAGLVNEFGGIEGVSALVRPDNAELPRCIGRAALFVGNDSGPAHLAAFCGVPTVVLVGPVDPARSAPRGAPVEVVWNQLDCAPCHFRRNDCIDNRCMKSISVDQVWTASRRLWSPPGGASSRRRNAQK